jgi:DNA-binding transcriptional ArsR family regulator
MSKAERSHPIPNVTRVFRALSNPRRREILRLVKRGERTAGEIAANFGVTRPAVSQDLQALTRAKLLHARRDATRRLYMVRPDGLLVLEHFLDEFWSTRLVQFKRAVESSRRRSRA